MNFLSKLKHVLNSDLNISYTENNALGYKTTGKNLLDLSFAIASLRTDDEQTIINKFIKAYFENRNVALVWLFYARDIRGGLGERRLFRVILQYLAQNNQEIPFEKLIEYIPFYGRYDDLFVLFGTKYENHVISMIKIQLETDIQNMEKSSGISLLAKWLPSINTSNKQTIQQAKFIAKKLCMTEKQYRHILSSLRAYINVVERKMSCNQFELIQYETVPSKANVLYKKAFLKHDKERRLAYLEKLVKGETTIHAGVLYPHDIVNSYIQSHLRFQIGEYDETLEQLWKALPSLQSELGNTIVVADGSGSMYCKVGNSSCTAIAVANALAIYFAEKLSGEFNNTYISFSCNPQLVDLSKGTSLKEKLQITFAYNEVANTDIYKVFELILHTAIKNSMKQDELPTNIIIISDMEFDACAKNADEPLFEHIKHEYAQNGYKLPRIIFWNVNSRTQTIPVIENNLGVALVSGFSVHIANMVMSNKLNPYECLLDILDTERYKAIIDILE